MKKNERFLHMERDGDPKFSRKWIEIHLEEIREEVKKDENVSDRDVLLKLIKDDGLNLDVDELLDYFNPKQ